VGLISLLGGIPLFVGKRGPLEESLGLSAQVLAGVTSGIGLRMSS